MQSVRDTQVASGLSGADTRLWWRSSTFGVALSIERCPADVLLLDGSLTDVDALARLRRELRLRVILLTDSGQDGLLAGRSTDAIALSLGVSRSTVNSHVQNILRKLGAQSRIEAVSIYLGDRTRQVGQVVVVDPGIVTVRVRPASAQPSSGLRVLIADENRTFAEVLAAGLSLERRFSTVDAACSPSHARLLLHVSRYDLLLFDPGNDVGWWLEFLRAAVSERPALVLVVVSEILDIEEVIQLMAQNVRAWVSKGVSLDGLLSAIDEAVLGHTSLPASLLGPVLKELLGRPPKSRTAPSFLNELTPRQLEVLRCLADGMSRAQVAERLLLSPHTVRTHVQEVLRKAGVNSTLAALAKAREVGFPAGAPADPSRVRPYRER